MPLLRPGIRWRRSTMTGTLQTLLKTSSSSGGGGQRRCGQHCRIEPRNSGDVVTTGQSSRRKSLRSVGQQALCPSGRRVPRCSGSSASSPVGLSVPAG